MSTVQERVQLRPLVIPWYIEKANLPPDLPRRLYRRLVADDALADLVHENHMSEDEFVAFVSDEKQCLLYVFLDLATNQFVGLAWLTEVARTDCFQKAAGAFAFFRNWWIPSITRVFGEIFLSQVFNILEIDVVWGLTPKSNRLAQIYSRRLGFRYEATLTNMTCHRGEITDAMLCTQSRTEFNSRLG